jgi:FkbM family methyltransferase
MTERVKRSIRGWLPKGVYNHRIKSGKLRGYRIYTSWHDYPAAIAGYTERTLLTWFEKNILPGETWLDVGAHYGYTAIALCKYVGPTGRVFAFEPTLSTVGYLAQTRVENKLNQLTVVPFGLGGDENLEIIELPYERGMLDSTVNGCDWRETLFVARLDWLWQAICGENYTIDGIKIDVQGMEVEVLRGMSGHLQAQKPKLIIELHKGVDRSAFLHQIKSCGYSPEAISLVDDEHELVSKLLDDTSYVFSPAQT